MTYNERFEGNCRSIKTENIDREKNLNKKIMTIRSKHKIKKKNKEQEIVLKTPAQRGL